MIVAGLDIATQTGVCLGAPGQTPTLFTYDMGKSQPHSARFASAIRLVQKLVKEHGVSAISFEQPIAIPRRDTLPNLLLLNGLVASIMAWASVQNVPIEGYAVSTIDKAFLGKASRGGRKIRKKRIVERCKMLGWEPKTQDEADAAAVWFYACAQINPELAHRTTPLFARRA